MANLTSVEVIATKILEIRGKKAMLDSELARLYGVATKQLIRQVKRNIARFPEDFMYPLTQQEVANLRCQFGTSRWGGRRYPPLVFTQEGVAMLSSVLNSKRAILVNILIMRAFVKLKELLLTHKDLAAKINALERKYAEHDNKIKQVFDAIRRLMQLPDDSKRVIAGFKVMK
ncbi:MAG: ORF6N domain-containing protein [Candidatus Omnitrophica bacterium]|nr:ORF6N domain-containing protein [Candidatus Omnitrophota bacterium]